MVKAIMRRHFTKAYPEDNIYHAAKILLETKASFIPVINNSGDLAGIITKDSILTTSLTSNDGKKLKEIMHHNYHIVYEEDSKELIYRNIGNHVILDSKQKVTGVLFKDDIVMHLYGKLHTLEDEIHGLKDKIKELNAVIESSYDGIYIADVHGKTITLNSAYEKITGLSRAELIGKNMRDLIDKGYFSESTTLIVAETKKPVTILQTLKSGKKIMCSGSPIFDDNGYLTKVVTNVRDITELDRLCNELKETEQQKNRYLEEVNHLRREQLNLGDMVIESFAMKKVLSEAINVSKIECSVLILGETGVGKDLVAKLIHKNSKRKDKPFIKINCGAIPENLLESELFGYEEGAFTGAKRLGKPGVFELADKGTLFLDEIAEMPKKLQVSLLRVLQEQEFMKVGGTKPIKTDVRLIYATNRDLTSMIKKGTFREDLYYRINVIPIYIPPLRERKDGMKLLILNFLHKTCKKYGIRKKMSEATIELMIEYNWPGNIRELKNVIQRLVITSNNSVIKPEDLPKYIFGAGIKNRNNLKNNKKEVLNLKNAVEDIEKRMIQKALKTYGTTRKAANALGVSQSTVVRKAQMFGIGEKSE